MAVPNRLPSAPSPPRGAGNERVVSVFHPRPRSVLLLDADPDLGHGLTPAELDAARRVTTARVRLLQPGDWDPGDDAEPPRLGLLILEGALLRDSRVAGRWCSEPLGPEDVLRPWDPVEAGGAACSWTVLEPARLAVLDHRFAAAAGRWPALLDEILHRAVRRSRVLAQLLSVASIPRLDRRLMVLLRLLADRWGRVGTDGVLLPVPLTHEALARLAVAQRPSVTSALGRLIAQGRIARLEGRGWLLRTVPGEEPAWSGSYESGLPVPSAAPKRSLPTAPSIPRVP